MCVVHDILVVVTRFLSRNRGLLVDPESNSPYFVDGIMIMIIVRAQLADPETSNLGPGEIRDSNRITLLLALKQQNFEAIDLGIVPDDPKQLKDALLQACDKGNIFITYCHRLFRIHLIIN